MKFCWTTLKVKDIEESIAFYQELVGLKINRRFQIDPGVEIVFLGNGETEIELIYDQNNQSIHYSDDISLGFEVESLDFMMTLIKDKGIEIHSGPISPNPFISFFYVLDPNGLKIQFVENKK